MAHADPLAFPCALSPAADPRHVLRQVGSHEQATPSLLWGRDVIRCAAAAMLGAGALTLFHTLRNEHKKVAGYTTAGVHLTVGSAMLLDSTLMCRVPKAKKATKLEPAPKK